MSYSSIPKDYVRTVLQHGIGRYVCQLQRVTLKFCKSYAGSRGMRDFIESDLIDFTRRNPGIVVYLQPRRHHGAQLLGEYLNGNQVNLNVDALNRDEVGQWLEHLRTRSGKEIVRIIKYQRTDHPSVQGIWTPFTHRDTAWNLTQYPCQQLSEIEIKEKSATHKIMEMYEQKQLELQKNKQDTIPSSEILEKYKEQASA